MAGEDPHGFSEHVSGHWSGDKSFVGSRDKDTAKVVLRGILSYDDGHSFCSVTLWGTLCT